MASVWKKSKVLPNAKNNYGYVIEKYIQKVINNPKKIFPNNNYSKNGLMKTSSIQNLKDTIEIKMEL